VLQVVTGYYII